ncbi:hypothetical protein ACFL17_06130 [Pseudomonadota bacterium]
MSAGRIVAGGNVDPNAPFVNIEWSGRAKMSIEWVSTYFGVGKIAG